MLIEYLVFTCNFLDTKDFENIKFSTHLVTNTPFPSSPYTVCAPTAYFPSPMPLICSDKEISWILVGTFVINSSKVKKNKKA